MEHATLKCIHVMYSMSMQTKIQLLNNNIHLQISRKSLFPLNRLLTKNILMKVKMMTETATRVKNGIGRPERKPVRETRGLVGP